MLTISFHEIAEVDGIITIRTLLLEPDGVMICKKPRVELSLTSYICSGRNDPQDPVLLLAN